MLDGPPRLALFFTDYSLPLAGLRDGSRKFIHDLRSGRSQWFDLDRDPGEMADRSAQHPAESRQYAETLEAWAAATASRRSPGR
jgi:hypothetical protein